MSQMEYDLMNSKYSPIRMSDDDLTEDELAAIEDSEGEFLRESRIDDAYLYEKD